MNIIECRTIDVTELLDKTSDLSQMMLNSAEMADYLYWKDQVAKDEAARRFRQKMQRVKDQLEECERFGHYHPNYHEALEAVKMVEQEMETVPSIREFKRAEQALDKLLYDVSELIAHSVSPSVKVPSNDPLPKDGGCGSGGSCGCG